MDRAGDGTPPLFSFNAYTVVTGLAMGVCLFIIWSVWAFEPGVIRAPPPSLGLVAFVLVFDVVLLVVGTMSLLRRVWSVRFFENGFTVRGRGLKREFSYSQVNDVQFYQVNVGFGRRQVIRIELNGDVSFTITKNPKNKTLNTDLYHWLKERTRGQEGAEKSAAAVTQSR
jgi:hypothetical protein